MKEHEDEVMQTAVSIDDTTVGIGKSVVEDEGEDMIVDVVGSGVVEEDCEEMESRDQDMEDVEGSGGIRVLTAEKEVVGSVETRVLTDVTERGLTDVGSVEEVVADGMIAESSVLTAGLVSEEANTIVEEGSRTKEVVDRVKEDSLDPTVEVKTDDIQETNAGDCVEGEKIEKENEVLDSSVTVVNPGSEDIDVVVVDEGLGSKDDVQDGIPVDPSLARPDVVDSVTGEAEINAHVDKLSEKEGLEQTREVVTETVVIVEKGLEVGLNKNEVIKDPTEPVQEAAYGNGVMDEKTGKDDDVVDSSKIPESLTTVNLGPDEVIGVAPNADIGEQPIVSCKDADMGRDDAGMDIDEVLGWKDDAPGTDVASGGEKDQHLNVTANSEDNVEQKLLGLSNAPVLIEHREEHVKSREPIVYGRRAPVEVPLYESRDVEQKLPESFSPVSEDENLKIETDSEDDEDEDEDNESMQEDEQKEDRQSSEHLANGNLFSLHQPSYFKPPENEGEFSVSDLVWGKVRSHPWWPGQIVDPSHASKKAMKYYKNDRYLVAYFGDHSFAWNSSSVLKPFRANYSQLEKQTDTEIFKTAASCALEEVSRRVELGLACSCVPKEIYKKIEYQVIENAGVRKQSEKRRGKDESASVSSFEPDKLVDYVRLLAQFPGQGDKLDLAITKAQLSSYGCYKGHRELPEFLVCGDVWEDDPVPETVEQVHKTDKKFESDLTESVNPNKEIILSDITDDAPESVGGTSKLVSSSGLKKRKARVSISNGSVKRPNRPAANKVSTPPVSTPRPSRPAKKVITAPVSTPRPNPPAKNVSTAAVATPKPSFKIGEMIKRVASQLTGPVVKSGSDPKVDHGQHVDEIVQTPENSQMGTTVADMLSQLHLTAQDPMKDHSFFQTIIPFFYERRAAVFSKSLKKPSTVELEQPDNGMKIDNDMQIKPSNENDQEEFDFDFDFDDVNDSYWTDRIIQNQSEEQPLPDDQNGAVEEQPVVEYEPEKPAKRRRRSSKKQRRVPSNEPEPEPKPEVEQESEIDRKRRENLATEIVLKFEEGINFRSEVQLNKMFRRFGPLMESETEVDRAGGRARVVFKKCFDAEVAHNSAGRFNIFGSINVSYELNYSPLVSYKPLPLPMLQQDPVPVLQEDPVPVLQEDVVPVLQEDPVPILQEDPVPVLQEDPMDAS